MQQVKPEVESFARIRVIGVGGSGKNAINHMINSKVRGVEFVAVNTDAQDLHHSQAKKKIHIGKNLTRGLGTGMEPDLGKRAAEETKEEIQEALKGSDMVFLAGGMGGGTGSGAAPVIAQAAKEIGALTVAVVTKPFSFEGQQRMRVADQALEALKNEVDALIVIPNDRLLSVVDRETTMENAFALCDNVLKQAVEGISDLITMPGTINVDFADVRSVMENAGSALMGIGTASGEKRAEEAAQSAINSPLLDISVSGAKGVLFAIAGGEDLGMLEIQDAAKVITESVDPNAKIIFGAIRDDKLKKNEVRVTVIATGFPEAAMQKSSTLFTLTGGEGSEETSETQEKEDGGGKIYNTVTPSADDKKNKKAKQESEASETENTDESIVGTTKKEPGAPAPDSEDDDDWGGVPAFLRRSKK